MVIELWHLTWGEMCSWKWTRHMQLGTPAVHRLHAVLPKRGVKPISIVQRALARHYLVRHVIQRQLILYVRLAPHHINSKRVNNGMSIGYPMLHMTQ